jgi:tetratricopeptide (TPR) repeat protein
VPLLLALAAALVGAPALFGAYVYDDLELIARRPAVLAFDLPALLTEPHFTGAAGYWRPLTMVALAVGHHLGGPFAIHLLALGLHVANTLLLWGLFRRTLPAVAAAPAALLFAVHPLQAEALGWCAAVNDPLWVLGALLACRSALSWRARSQRGWPLWPCVWLGCGLLAKENALVAPLLLAAVWRWAPGATGHAGAGRRLATSVAVLLVLWWLLRTLVFQSLLAGLGGGAAPPFDGWRQASAPAELALRHVALLGWPWPMSPFRPFAGALSPVAALGWLVGAAALLAAAGLAWRRLLPAGRLALALLALPIAPTLGRWATLGAYPVADRYLYLSVAGFAAAVALASQRWRWGPRVLLALALGIAPATAWQSTRWRSQEQLLAHGLASAPNDPNLHVLAGDLALQSAQAGMLGARPRAQEHYATALRLLGGSPGPAQHRAEAGARLGLAYCAWLDEPTWRQDGGRALVAAFERAVAADPARASAWIGLGIAHASLGQADAAERAFRSAIQREPRSSEAWCNLGRLQLGRGQREAARTSLREALRWGPGNQAASELLSRAQ